MVFFTRELYLGMQPQSGWERRAEREWERRAALYAKYAKTIAELLPQAVRRLCKHGLHDAIIREASFAKSELTLVLDAANSMSEFRGKQIRLTFRGVRGRRAVTKLIGQWWLYEEAHLRSGGRFCLSILLDPSEIDIEADDLTIEAA